MRPRTTLSSCPACEVGPGLPCIALNGRVRSRVHADRPLDPDVTPAGVLYLLATAAVYLRRGEMREARWWLSEAATWSALLAT